jgi:hypothetical protein
MRNQSLQSLSTALRLIVAANRPATSVCRSDYLQKKLSASEQSNVGSKSAHIAQAESKNGLDKLRLLRAALSISSGTL